jgi:hypothetical protein
VTPEVTGFWQFTMSHEKCIRRPKWNSLKIKLEMEIGVTGSWEVPEFREFNDGSYGIAGCCAECEILIGIEPAGNCPTLANNILSTASSY